jgi:hypothetical protein
MKVYIRRYSPLFTRWGVFTNLWPTHVSKKDRNTDGIWYCNLHTPLGVVECYGELRATA